MENSVKALLIAAGVLVTILVISLGVTIFNKSSSIEDYSSTMTELEVTRFNKKYQQYEGIHSGKTVKKVLGYVMDDNDFLNSERNGDIGINVRSNVDELIAAFPGWGNALTDRQHGVMHSNNVALLRNEISASKKYKIWYSYDKNGLIHEIHIDKAYE